MTQPLSPAALAVWDRFCGIVEEHGPARLGLAAALQAAADQVVPVASKPNDTFCCPPVETIVWKRLACVREELLAIAAELKTMK